MYSTAVEFCTIQTKKGKTKKNKRRSKKTTKKTNSALRRYAASTSSIIMYRNERVVHSCSKNDLNIPVMLCLNFWK